MIDRIVIWIEWKCGNESTFNNRSQLRYTCFVTDSCVNGRILYDGDFNYLDPNSLVFVIFINLKSEIFAEGQSFVLHSGLREAFFVSSAAWAQVFI